MTLGLHVNRQQFVEKLAEKLKTIPEIKAPDWAAYVKTGMHKERPPVDRDWWHKRTASILYKVLRYGPIGVSKLRRAYGGRKNRGVKPEHFYKGSANIIRKVLQQLEKAELVKKTEKGVHKGKIVTPKGASLIHSVAKTMIPKEALEQFKTMHKMRKEDKKEDQKKDDKKEGTKAEAKNEPGRTQPA